MITINVLIVLSLNAIKCSVILPPQTVTEILENATIADSDDDQVTDNSNRIVVPVSYTVEDKHLWRRAPQPFAMPPNLNNTGAVTFNNPNVNQAAEPTKTLQYPTSFSYQQHHGSKDLNPAPTLQYWGTKGHYDDLLRNQSLLSTEPTTFFKFEDGEAFISEKKEPQKDEELESQEEEEEEEVVEATSRENEPNESEPENQNEEINDENEELEEEEEESDDVVEDKSEDDDEEDKSDIHDYDDEDAQSEYSETQTKIKPIAPIPLTAEEEVTPKAYSHLLEKAKQDHERLFEENKKQYGRKIDDIDDIEIVPIKHEKIKRNRKPKYRIVRVYDDDDDDDDATPSNSDIIERSTPKVHSKLQIAKLSDGTEAESPPVYTIGDEKVKEELATTGEESRNNPTQFEVIKDNKPQESTNEAKKAPKKKKNTKFKKGGGKETEEEHHGKHGEKGDKGYKGHHEHEKGEKGHHDKEAHKGSYEDHGGHEKKHKHEEGHHSDHKKGEKGEKGAKVILIFKKCFSGYGSRKSCQLPVSKLLS